MFEAWSLRHSKVAENEESLRQRIRCLSDTQRVAFYRHYTPLIKDPDTYAALNWFFLAGLHNFYLGQWLFGLLDLTIMVAGCILLFFTPLIGISMIVFVSLIEMPALFRSQIIVAHRNNQIGFQALDQYCH